MLTNASKETCYLLFQAIYIRDRVGVCTVLVGWNTFCETVLSSCNRLERADGTDQLWPTCNFDRRPDLDTRNVAFSLGTVDKLLLSFYGALALLAEQNLLLDFCLTAWHASPGLFSFDQLQRPQQLEIGARDFPPTSPMRPSFRRFRPFSIIIERHVDVFGF